MNTCYEGNHVLIELVSHDEVCEKAYMLAPTSCVLQDLYIGFSTVIDCCCRAGAQQAVNELLTSLL